MFKKYIIILINFLGGPVVTYENYGNEKGQKRAVLIGTAQATFADCTNNVPNTFVEIDDLSTLTFLRREAYGTGKVVFKLWGENFQIFFKVVILGYLGYS